MCSTTIREGICTIYQILILTNINNILISTTPHISLFLAPPLPPPSRQRRLTSRALLHAVPLLSKRLVNVLSHQDLRREGERRKREGGRREEGREGGMEGGREGARNGLGTSERQAGS